MSQTSRWWQSVSRVVTRPRPWILRYLLHLLPAVVLAVLIAGSMLPLFRIPLMTEALRTRSLGDLLEIVRSLEDRDSGFVVLGTVGFLLLTVVTWLPVQLAGLWIEGGVLQTYAADRRLDRRAFWSACRRTFKSFLVLGLAQSLAVGVVIGIALALGAALDLLLVLGIAAALGTWVLMVLGELVRVIIVIEDDRHLVRALGGALRLIRRRVGSVFLLVAVSVALHLLLFFAQRTGARTMPTSWWALSLLVQQSIQILGAGVRLARQAGMVGLAHTAGIEASSEEGASKDG